MTLLRGRKRGLEVVLGGADLEEALGELEARLAEQASFYRGASATACFGSLRPSTADLSRLRALLEGAGIELRGLSGEPALAELAQAHELAFEVASPPADELACRPSGRTEGRLRALRPRGEVQLSDSARSLVADFAGARHDIAQRRKRGEASVPRPSIAVRREKPAKPALSLVEGPGVLYHAGTLRGGQTLHHGGHLVIVGDVNPGAELVAAGDILVFGRLAGIAHAGAKGDAGARIYAVDLAATQLRIATFIAADADAQGAKARAAGAEVALVRDGGIVILTLDRLDQLSREGISLA